MGFSSVSRGDWLGVQFICLCPWKLQKNIMLSYFAKLLKFYTSMDIGRGYRKNTEVVTNYFKRDI